MSVGYAAREFEGKSVPGATAVGAHSLARRLQIFGDLVFAPEALSSVGTSVVTVAVLGGAEALKMSRKGTPGRLKFAFRYGVSQVLPSIIWATKPANLVCKRAKLDPKLLLETALGSKRESQIHQLQTVRSIIAGFVGIAQILRIVDLAGDADSKYRESVSNGREPFIPGVSERVIRLAGKTRYGTLFACAMHSSDAANGATSDVTALSMMTGKQHIVPVFENPAAVRDLVITATSLAEHHASRGPELACDARWSSTATAAWSRASGTSRPAATATWSSGTASPSRPTGSSLYKAARRRRGSCSSWRLTRRSGRRLSRLGAASPATTSNPPKPARHRPLLLLPPLPPPPSDPNSQAAYHNL